MKTIWSAKTTLMQMILRWYKHSMNLNMFLTKQAIVCISHLQKHKALFLHFGNAKRAPTLQEPIPPVQVYSTPSSSCPLLWVLLCPWQAPYVWRLVLPWFWPRCQLWMGQPWQPENGAASWLLPGEWNGLTLQTKNCATRFTKMKYMIFHLQSNSNTDTPTSVRIWEVALTCLTTGVSE